MKIDFRVFRQIPNPMPTEPDASTYNQDDNYQIAYYAANASGGGGGGGDATAANQTLQLAQETTTATQTTTTATQTTNLNSKFSGISGYGNTITLSAGSTVVSGTGSWFPNCLIIDMSGNLPSGRTITIEVSLSGGSGNYRTVLVMNSNSKKYIELMPGEFYNVRFTLSAGIDISLTYFMTTQNEYSAVRDKNSMSVFRQSDSPSTAGTQDTLSVFKRYAADGSNTGNSVFTNEGGTISHFEDFNRKSVFTNNVNESVFTSSNNEETVFSKLTEIQNSLFQTFSSSTYVSTTYTDPTLSVVLNSMITDLTFYSGKSFVLIPPIWDGTNFQAGLLINV